GYEYAQHCKALRWPPSAERPCEDSRKEDTARTADGRQHSHPCQRFAEERQRELCLNGYAGAVIDVPPGEIAPAHNVVKLVAKVAVTDVRFPQVRCDVQHKL